MQYITPTRAPDAVVVPHHVDALRVRQVALLYEEAEDAPAAELELLPDDALQVRHHAARVQVHEQPAHPAVHHGRRRVVEVEPHADKAVAVSSHHWGQERHSTPKYSSSSAGDSSGVSDRMFHNKSPKSLSSVQVFELLSQSSGGFRQKRL